MNETMTTPGTRRSKASRFVHIVQSRGRYALFNSLNLKVAYLTPLAHALWECLKSGVSLAEAEALAIAQGASHLKGMFDLLTESGFLVDVDCDEEEIVAGILDQELSPHPEFSVLKLFLTTHCNFDCRYCLIEHNLDSGPWPFRLHMAATTGRRSIELFAHYASLCQKREKTIFFYGGEPLLNFGVLSEIIQCARKLEGEGAFGGSLELVLETNGSLLTRERAEFLAEHDVCIIVSIDGPPEIHDKMRLTKGGGPTHRSVTTGYRVAVESGCNVVVSTVFSPLFAENVESAIAYLAENVHALSIGLDLMHVRVADDGMKDVSKDLLINKYIEAFRLAREHGLYIEHIMRRIRPFVEESRRIKDCPACGSRIVISPEGDIGLCEGFIGSREFFVGNVQDPPELMSNPSFMRWNQCTPYLDGGCLRCKALSICGGVCPYNSWVTSGQLLGHDYKTCAVAQALIEWMIWDLAGRLGERLQQDLYIPSVHDKRLLYGNIPARAALPLVQTVSKYAEHKIAAPGMPSLS